MNDNVVSDQVNDSEQDTSREQLVRIQGNTLETDNGNSIIGFEDLAVSGAPQLYEYEGKIINYFMLL